MVLGAICFRCFSGSPCFFIGFLGRVRVYAHLWNLRESSDQFGNGNYFFGFDPYDVPNEINNYYVRVGHPDGTVDVFEGVITKSTIVDDFIADDFAAWGIPSYRLITVTKTGASFVVKNEGPS